MTPTVVSATLVVAALAAVLPTLEAASITADVAGLHIDLVSEPKHPGTRQPTTYRLRLAQDGVPVTGMKITLQGRMADGMTVVGPLAPAREPGIYVGRVLFTMEGPWTLTLRVTGKNRAFELPLIEQVGR